MKFKKAVSNIIVISLFLIIISSILVVTWIFTRNIILKSPAELSCISYMNSLKVEKACYLESNELKIVMRRNSDDFELKNIRVLFSPFGSVWEISGKKCADIRLDDKGYGNYCEIVQPGNMISYIFNMTNLDKQNKVGLYPGIGDSVCTGDLMSVRGSC